MAVNNDFKSMYGQQSDPWIYQKQGYLQQDQDLQFLHNEHHFNQNINIFILHKNTVKAVIRSDPLRHFQQIPTS